MHVVIISSKLNFKQIGHELVSDIQTDEHTEITFLYFIYIIYTPSCRNRVNKTQKIKINLYI